MKKERIFHLLFVLFVLMAGFNFASCSDDDDEVTENVTPPVEGEEEGEGEGEGEGEQDNLPNPAGDDFYMFVNGDWHKGITDNSTSQGYMIDVAEHMEELEIKAISELDAIKTMAASLNNLNATQKESEAVVKSITDKILADVNTKDDAFRAIGVTISMGLTNFFKVHMATGDEVIGYTLGMGEIEGDEEDEEDEASVGFVRKLHFKEYKKLSASSRATNNELNCILEGLGMDKEFYLHDESIDEDIAELKSYSKNDLKAIIKEAIEAELLPYCADKYAKEYTDGSIKTTKEYLSATSLKELTYSISHKFTQIHVTPELKETFKGYGEELRSVLSNRIENSTWLSAQTKQAAKDKLAKMKMFFGEPDQWHEEHLPNPEGKLLVSDMLEVKQSRVRLITSMLGKDKQEYAMSYALLCDEEMTLTEYNAFYIPNTNTLHLLPAFMIAPEYEPNMETSKKYSTFYVLGHEMTHGFDLEGAEYDAKGNKNNWWTAEDKSMFEALNSNLSEQISTFEASPGIKADGTKTVTEDVADLGGLNIAFDALTENLKKNGVTGDKLKEEQQNFFKHHAYRFRKVYSSEELQEQLEDVHSVSIIRVNGIVQHMNSWYDLFNVKDKDALFLPSDKRVTIW